MVCILSTSSAASRHDGTSKYWRFWLPQLLRSLLMISCAWKRRVKPSELSNRADCGVLASRRAVVVRDTARASDYIVADSAFLMRELSPANAGITRSFFFYYFCFVFGERPGLIWSGTKPSDSLMG